MSPLRIVGYVLVVVGVALLLIGIRMTDSWANWFTNMFAGRWTHGTLQMIVGGIVCLVGGGLIVLFGMRHPRV